MSLKLLDDKVFEPTKDQQDNFNHEIYADILTDIFEPEVNKNGISVALFGKWGQGKSSVVRMLEKRLAEDETNTELILFNAWHARGDSVRRQLLLQIIEILDPEKAEELKRFFGTELAYGVLKTDETGHKEIFEAIKVFTKKVCVDSGTRFWAICLFVLGVILFATQKFAADMPTIQSTFNSLILPLIIGLTVKTYSVLKNRFFGVLGISEPISESQKLKYPEQFQELFLRYASKFCRETGRQLLIVVDDLDRCEPATVVEALASIRQLNGADSYIHKEGKFKGQKLPVKVQFLVPCDEHQVVLALEADGHHIRGNDGRYHDYQKEELLRKFFDVIVRMDSFVPEDMIKYTDEIAQQLKITEKQKEDLRELIGVVAPRDPRQAKKLVNAFLVSTRKVDALRSKQALDPENMADFPKTHLAVIALQETVPAVFSDIVNDLELYECLRIGEEKVVDKNDHYKRASKIIQHLAPTDAGTFRQLALKGLPRELVGVENAVALMDALNGGDGDEFSSAFSKNSNAGQILKWLRDRKTTITTDIQLRNVFSCLLAVFEKEGVLSVFDYYLSHNRLQRSLNEFSDLLQLTSHFDSLSTEGQTAVRAAIYKNFSDAIPDKTDSEKLFSSVNARALFSIANRLTTQEQKSIALRLKPRFVQSDAQESKKVLRHLQAGLKGIENSAVRGAFPVLAEAIAKDCSWGFYADGKDLVKELHSALIPLLCGDDEAYAGKIMEGFFSTGGLLAQPVKLAPNTTNPQEEAWKTLRHVSGALSDEKVQVFYMHLKPWLAPQGNDPKNVRVICNAIKSGLFRLKDAQLEEFANFLADRTQHAADPEWICEFVSGASADTENKYHLFYETFFIRYSEIKLKPNPTISDADMKFLGAVKQNKWPVSTQAESLFAHVIATHCSSAQIFGKWEASLWPLCSNSTEIRRAVCDRLKNGHIVEALLPFCTEKMEPERISLDVADALHLFIKQSVDAALGIPALITLFEENENQKPVNGVEQVLEYLVVDLHGKDDVSDKHVQFICKYIHLVSSDHKQKWFDILEKVYLRSDKKEKQAKGISYVKQTGSAPDHIKRFIEQAAKDNASDWSEETKNEVTQILGRNVFGKQENEPGE